MQSEKSNATEFDTLLEAHASMKVSEKQRNRTAQANMTKGPQKKSPPNHNEIKLTEEERKRRKQFCGKCYRCGAGDHMIPQCRVPTNVTCNSCKCQGHIANVCSKSLSVRAYHRFRGTIAAAIFSRSNFTCCNFFLCASVTSTV